MRLSGSTYPSGGYQPLKSFLLGDQPANGYFLSERMLQLLSYILRCFECLLQGFVTSR